jgi:hypothetical protein
MSKTILNYRRLKPSVDYQKINKDIYLYYLKKDL